MFRFTDIEGQETQSVTMQYGMATGEQINGIPTTFIIDRDGYIVKKYIGPIRKYFTKIFNLIYKISNKRNRIGLFANFLFVGLFVSYSEAVPSNSYWQQQVNYYMEVKLHNDLRQLACKSIITYVNNSPDTLDRLYLHLYPNAFQKNL